EAIWDERHRLANFGPVPVSIRSGDWVRTFSTSEALYQSCKFYPKDFDIRENIRNASTPSDAKAISKEHKKEIRPDWSKIRPKVMRGVIRLKVKQNPDLQQELLQTVDREIYEDADKYAPKNPDEETIKELRRWAIYQGEGENLIGRILMDLRKELQDKGKLK
ncbi:NADAR family protein, partial [Candidatus Microgenomates bacterium]|nr:NADAR family protein [Candidatus Microgenomates bacterium]